MSTLRADATTALRKLDDGQNDDVAMLHRRRREEDAHAAIATNRKPWDSSVWHYVPAALKGIEPVTPEPWARDGAAYMQGMSLGHGIPKPSRGKKAVDSVSAAAARHPAPAR